MPIDLTLKPRPRDRERRIRRKLSGWDRSKYTLLLGGLFVFYWWQKIDDNPIKSVNDAFWETIRNQAWMLVLLGLEWIRQIHFMIAEHSAAYYGFWKGRVFGRFEGRSERLDPWTRYRVARVLRWMFAIVVVSVMIGQITDQSPVDAMISLPGRINNALPMAARLLIYPLLLISQFVALFWFLGRGGIETYFPDDIDTRFDDVWGQDPVQGEGPGEPDLPREPGGDRGPWRLHAGRHPALRSARYRQDAAGRGGRGGDRQAVRVRRSRRLHQHVHGRRHHQGAVVVPQAPQVGASVRRRRCVLRRGRFARQPRRRQPGGYGVEHRVDVPRRRQRHRVGDPLPVGRRSAGAVAVAIDAAPRPGDEVEQ